MSKHAIMLENLEKRGIMTQHMLGLVTYSSPKECVWVIRTSAQIGRNPKLGGAGAHFNFREAAQSAVVNDQCCHSTAWVGRKTQKKTGIHVGFTSPKPVGRVHALEDGPALFQWLL